MPHTLYVTFLRLSHVEKAMGKLLEKGVLEEHISVIQIGTDPVSETENAESLGEPGGPGTSSTTAENDNNSAQKSSEPGIATGVLAGIAASVPSLSQLLGRGSLKINLSAPGSTTPSEPGGVELAEFLKEQGLPDTTIRTYNERLQTGGSLIAVTLPSGDVDLMTGEEILSMFGGADITVTVY